MLFAHMRYFPDDGIGEVEEREGRSPESLTAYPADQVAGQLYPAATGI